MNWTKSRSTISDTVVKLIKIIIISSLVLSLTYRLSSPGARECGDLRQGKLQRRWPQLPHREEHCCQTRSQVSEIEYWIPWVVHKCVGETKFQQGRENLIFFLGKYQVFLTLLEFSVINTCSYWRQDVVLALGLLPGCPLSQLIPPYGVCQGAILASFPKTGKPYISCPRGCRLLALWGPN